MTAATSTSEFRVVSLPHTQTPPLTEGLPLLGSLPRIIKNNVEVLAEARQHHGDVYALNLGLTSIVMVCKPEYAQHVLRDNARNYPKGGPMWDSIRTMLGNGLVVSEGDFWLRQRRMMQPQFHRQYLSKMTDLMINAIETGMANWDERAEAGSPVEMLDAFNHVTMQVIVQTMFGRGLSDEDADTMGREMAYALDYILPNMIASKLPEWMPFPGRVRYQEAIAKLDEFLFRIVRQRRESGSEEHDMLGMLLDLVDDETGEAMTDQQIRDEIATLFLAGYETTSLTLSWGIHHLTRNPDVMEKLHAEIDGVLGGATPTFESMTQLPYTRQVLQEIMRIHPPAFWIPRTATEDDEIGGFQIKAGQMVGVSIYNIHRHPDIWDAPDTFDPERFAPENAKQRHQLAWMPFGAGQRLCLGRDFSLMEGTLVLAMMLQRYKFNATDHVAQPGLSTTLRPKDGVYVTMHKRA